MFVVCGGSLEYSNQISFYARYSRQQPLAYIEE